MNSNLDNFWHFYFGLQTITKMIQNKVEKDIMMRASKIDNKKITNKPPANPSQKKAEKTSMTS